MRWRWKKKARPSSRAELANIKGVENTSTSQIEPTRQLAGTRLSWRGLRGWLDTVYAVNRKMRCSEPSHARARRLYRALDLEDVRRSICLEDLEELLALLRSARYTDAPLRYGLARAYGRSELGRLIVETTNHLRWVRRGCPVREAGPRLDPSRLPDDRLDHLIQTHADMNLVERLRQERARRQMVVPSGTNIQGR